MWIPEKAAFRAGVVTETEWDAANVGAGSVAFGGNNQVEGAYSVAFGMLNSVTGDYCFVTGQNNVMFGTGGFIAGDDNANTHLYATILGFCHTSAADYQTITGKYSNAGAGHVFVVGNGTSTDVRSNALELTFTGDLEIAGNYIGGNVTSGADPGHTHSIYGLLAGNNVWAGTNNIKLDSANAFVVEKADGTDVFVFNTMSNNFEIKNVGSFKITGTSNGSWTPVSISSTLGGSGTSTNELMYLISGSGMQTYTSTLGSGDVNMVLIGLNFTAVGQNVFNGDANCTSYPQGVYMIAYNESTYNAGGNDVQGARGAFIYGTIDGTGTINKTGGTLQSNVIGAEIIGELDEGYSDVINGQYYNGARTGELYGIKARTTLFLQNDYQSDFRPIHRGIYSLIQIDDYYSQTDFTAVAFYGDYSSPNTSIVPDNLYCIYNNMDYSKNLLGKDNIKSYFGTGEDASIVYNGTNFILNAQEVGTGNVVLKSAKTTTGDPVGEEGMIYWNTVDNVIKMYADGAWRILASW